MCVSTCVCAKSLQSCLALCNPMDSSPPGPSVHGILQARILQWVVIPSPGTWVERRPDLQVLFFGMSCLGGVDEGQDTGPLAWSNIPVPPEFHRSIKALDTWKLLRPTGLPVISPLRLAKNILVTHQYSQVTWGLVTCCPRGAGDPPFCLGPGKTLPTFYFPEDGKSTF